MDRIQVSSSNIQAIGYSAHLKLLEVEFKDGRVYEIQGIESIIYNEFMNASSLGAYFAKYIKDKYPIRRIK